MPILVCPSCKSPLLLTVLVEEVICPDCNITILTANALVDPIKQSVEAIRAKEEEERSLRSDYELESILDAPWKFGGGSDSSSSIYCDPSFQQIDSEPDNDFLVWDLPKTTTQDKKLKERARILLESIGFYKHEPVNIGQIDPGYDNKFARSRRSKFGVMGPTYDLCSCGNPKSKKSAHCMDCSFELRRQQSKYNGTGLVYHKDYCPVCGNLKTITAKYCRKCSNNLLIHKASVSGPIQDSDNRGGKV